MEKKDCFAYKPKKNLFTGIEEFYCNCLNVENCYNCKFYKKLSDFPKGYFESVRGRQL